MILDIPCGFFSDESLESLTIASYLLLATKVLPKFNRTVDDVS
jgi:hypothetical protein